MDDSPFGSSSQPAAAARSSATDKSRPVRSTASKPANGSAPIATRNQEGAKPVESKQEDNTSQAEVETPKLVGLKDAQVAEVLGPPMAETEKAPGKVWRYWNSKCSLDVSMYLDIQSRAYRVLSYEVTNHGNPAGGRSACLAELPKSNLQPTSAGQR